MRAQFVLNEDYNSLKELHKVSFEIFSWFKEKNIKRLNPLKEDSDEFDIRNIVDSKKYEKIDKFIQSGIGLIYGDISDEEWQEAGAIIYPPDYKNVFTPESLEKYKVFKSGFIIFCSRENLLHELQHAYDYWISGGKNQRSGYNGLQGKILSNSGINYDAEVAKYYLDPVELNAYFSEAISGHYWAGLEQTMEKKNRDYVFYDWNDQLYWFKKGFKPWEYISESQKKKYINKFYIYYSRVKEIWESEGLDGLKKRNLKIR